MRWRTRTVSATDMPLRCAAICTNCEADRSVAVEIATDDLRLVSQPAAGARVLSYKDAPRGASSSQCGYDSSVFQAAAHRASAATLLPPEPRPGIAM